MKKVMFLAGAIATATLMFTSCKHEQSELDLEAMPNEAVITGTVKYDAGSYKAEDGALISNYLLPASGQTVMVTVPMGDYVSGSQGNKTYTAQVDENGKYRISIPVGVQSVNATVSVIPFEAEKFVETEGTEVVSIPDALYNELTEQTVSLSQQKIQVVDMQVSSKTTLDVQYDQEVSLQGLVKAQAWVKNVDTDEWEAGEVSFETPLIVSVRIVDPSGEQPNVSMKYTVSSSAEDGSYSLKMKLPSDCWQKNVEVKVERQASKSEFTHRYFSNADAIWKAQTIEVIYNQVVAGPVSLNSSHKLVPMDMADMVVTVTPVDLSSVKGIGNPSDIEEDIALNDVFGWNY